MFVRQHSSNICCPPLQVTSLRASLKQQAARGDVLLDTALDISGPDFADLADDYFDPSIDFADMLKSQTGDGSAQHDVLEPLSLASYSKASTHPEIEIDQAMYPFESSILAVPSHSPPVICSTPELG